MGARRDLERRGKPARGGFVVPFRKIDQTQRLEHEAGAVERRVRRHRRAEPPHLRHVAGRAAEREHVRERVGRALAAAQLEAALEHRHSLVHAPQPRAVLAADDPQRTPVVGVLRQRPRKGGVVVAVRPRHRDRERAHRGDRGKRERGADGEAPALAQFKERRGEDERDGERRKVGVAVGVGVVSVDGAEDATHRANRKNRPRRGQPQHRAQARTGKAEGNGEKRQHQTQDGERKSAVERTAAKHRPVVEPDAAGHDDMPEIHARGHRRVENAPPQRFAEDIQPLVVDRIGLAVERDRPHQNGGRQHRRITPKPPRKAS